MRSSVRRLFILACIASAGLALGVGPVLAQAPAKSCSHEGKLYKDGEKVNIGGKVMECDGASGTWVPAQQ
jgi:hypothetical protein